MDAAFDLARNIVKTEYKDIPPKAIEIAKMDILDILGTAMAGSSAPGIKETVDLVKGWGGAEESTIFVYGGKVPSLEAALANAAMAHAPDYDDTHDGGIVHTGVAVVPTAFAVAELKKTVGGKEFLSAVSLAIDLACRIGLADRKAGVPQFGFGRRTDAISYFAATAAAGKLLGLDEEKMVNAFGIALSQTSGSLQCVIDGALSKRFQPAFGSRAGILSALMAEKGITGARNVFQGTQGFYNLFSSGNCDPSQLTSALGSRFEVANLSFKPYPCCRFTNPFIDATLGIVNEHDIHPDEIDEVTVFVTEEPHHLCEPSEVKKRPRTIVDAQFSIPYTVATAIVKKRVAIADFTEEAIRDAAVLKVAQKVRPHFDPQLLRGDIPPAIVEIRTKGKVYSKRIDCPYGDPKNPLSWDDLAAKFIDCASYAAKEIPAKNVEAVIEMVRGLEEMADVSRLIQFLSWKRAASYFMPTFG